MVAYLGGKELRMECHCLGWSLIASTLTIEWTDAAESSYDSYVQVNLASLLLA